MFGVACKIVSFGYTYRLILIPYNMIKNTRVICLKVSDKIYLYGVVGQKNIHNILTALCAIFSIFIIFYSRY